MVQHHSYAQLLGRAELLSLARILRPLVFMSPHKVDGYPQSCSTTLSETMNHGNLRVLGIYYPVHS
jgi:hypothetical protein